MSRVTITATKMSSATNAATLTYSNSTSNEYCFVNDGRCFARVKNGNAADLTVTSVLTKKIDGVAAAADATATVGSSTGEKNIGPWPVNLYNNDAGYVWLNFSSNAADHQYVLVTK